MMNRQSVCSPCLQETRESEVAAERVRVAICLYRDEPYGGSFRVGETLARHLDGARIDLHVIFAYGGPGPVGASGFVPCHYLEAGSCKHPSAWLRARRLLKQLQPEIIHFVDPVNWVAFAGLGLGTLHLLHIHGRPIVALMSRFDRAVSLVRRWISDGFVAITQGAAESAVAAGFAVRSRTWVVYNGVAGEFFGRLPAKSTARCQLGLPQDAKLIGQAARLCGYNGEADLLRLLRLLPEEWHAVFAGGGPFRRSLEVLASELKLTERVHFLGWQADVRPFYAALDAVALLAPYQPFCLMIAEAMASGVPVVGIQDQGEYAEPENPLVTETNCLLVRNEMPWKWGTTPERDHMLAEVAARIVERFADPCALAAQVASARDHAARHFHARLQAEAMTEVYYRLKQVGKRSSLL